MTMVGQVESIRTGCHAARERAHIEGGIIVLLA